MKPCCAELAPAWWFRGRLAQLRRTLALAQRLGVRIASGYDAGEESMHGNNPQRIVALMRTLGCRRWRPYVQPLCALPSCWAGQHRSHRRRAVRRSDRGPWRSWPISASLSALRFVMKGGQVLRDG